MYINEHMKKQILQILIFSLFLSAFYSCKRECSRKVVEMELVPVSKTKTDRESNVEGYYENEFQKGSINFVIDFTHQGAGEFCEYSWSTYPVKNGMKLFAGNSIILDADTITIGEDISQYFTIENLEKNFLLQYLITSKSSVPDSGKYKVIGSLELDNSTVIKDSVLIEMN